MPLEPDVILPVANFYQFVNLFMVIFHKPIEAFIFFSLLIYITLPLFSKRGISVLSSIWVCYAFEGQLGDVEFLLQNISSFVKKNYPELFKFLSHCKNKYPFLFPSLKEKRYTNLDPKYAQLESFNYLANLFHDIKYTAAQTASWLRSFFSNFTLTGLSYFFPSIRSSGNDEINEPLLRRHSLKLSAFIFFYIWQYDSLIPIHPILYTWSYSPFRYIWILATKLIYYLVLTRWIGFLSVSSIIFLYLYSRYTSACYILKHSLFTLGLVLCLDSLIFWNIFGFDFISSKTISTFINLFVGAEYVPYITSGWKELSIAVNKRFLYWLQVSSKDSNFHVYFWASFIFILCGFSKVLFDLIDFGVSEWYPLANEGKVINIDFFGILSRSLNITYGQIVETVAKFLSISGFCALGLLFLIWDDPSNANTHILYTLSIPVGFILMVIGFLCVHTNGPFSEDPFQLVGLLYTIYAKDVSEAEESASQVASGGYDCASPSPLISPLQALKGKDNRKLALQIPQLVVALLCDTGLFPRFLISTWYFLHRIIRSVSTHWLAVSIENSSFFLILESFKNPDQRPTLSYFQSKYFRLPFEEITQEKKEQSLLLGTAPSWDSLKAFTMLFLRPPLPVMNQFAQGRHGRHLCRLLLESLLYGALFSSKILSLPKGSVYTTIIKLGWVLWTLFWTTLIPRAISQESFFDKLFRESPRNVLRSLFAKQFLYSSSDGLGMSVKKVVSYVPEYCMLMPSHVTVLRWLLNAQPHGYVSLSNLLSPWLFGLPMRSKFISLFFLRVTAFSLGAFNRASYSMLALLLVPIGGTFLMTYMKPWHWMDFLAILTINCIVWGWKPSTKLVSNSLYHSKKQQLIDGSLTIWMSFSIFFGVFGLSFLLPHFPARFTRPSRILFQIGCIYVLKNVPQYLFSIFGGHFGEFVSLLGTGIVIFSISSFETFMYRKIMSLISKNYWSGLKISYGQGDAIGLFTNQSNSYNTTSNNSIVVVGPCPAVRTYWLDEIFNGLGGRSIPVDEIYPTASCAPTFFDRMDVFFFSNDEYSERDRSTVI